MDYPIYNYLTCPYDILKEIPTVYKIGNNGGEHSKVLDLITSFDIETSKLPDEDQSFMYIWQFCFYKRFVVVGRTWTEFKIFMQTVSKTLGKKKLAVYVHNLSYEFCWLKALFKMDPSDVFCMDKRKVLKCTILENIEFRCSLLLTNMSLLEWCITSKNEHQKIELEYEVLRYPWTPLTDDELTYCINDVIAVCECLDILMQQRGDTLATIPKTSTGFVRREAKRVMRYSCRWANKLLPTLDQYLMLRSGFRGGNVHASRLFAGHIINNVISEDESSAYPGQMLCSDHFPMSVFKPIENAKDFRKLYKAWKCMIFRCKLKNVKLKEKPFISVPYIAIANCEKCDFRAVDNGRLLEGDLTACFTEIDFSIIEKQYTFKFEFLGGYWSEPGPLPAPFRRMVAHFYEEKTKLKDVSDDEIPGASKRYAISKEYINALYGMMVQDPLKDNIIFLQDAEDPDDIFSLDASRAKEYQMDRYLKNGWLPYQWGCWVTALARQALQKAIDLVDQTEDAYFIYCDTDSVKYWGNVDFEKLNKPIRKRAEECWGVAEDPKGRNRYVSVFEEDARYDRYLTLGAKKYFFEKEGKLGITVAGIPKKRGRDYLRGIGGLDSIKLGMTFPSSAIKKLASIYNDHIDEKRDVIDHGVKHTIHLIDNCCLVPVDYTLDLTPDYQDLLLSQEDIEEILVVLCGEGEYNVAAGC